MLRLSSYKINRINIFYFVLLIGYIISQWPFLIADADIHMAYGRGSWTDEGLNTCQIRNFVNHGHFNLLDCDNLLKTPLFSFFLFPFFKFIGISLFKARLITTLFCTIILLLGFLHDKLRIYIGGVFLLSTMLFLPIHQYSHLCLAEIYSSLLIILSALTYSFFNPKKNKSKISRIILLLALVIGFKIQFIYVLGIPLLVYSLSYFQDQKTEKRRELVWSFILIGSLLLIFLFVWYLPFTIEWKQIAKQQSGGFSFSKLSFNLIKENLTLNFLSLRLLPFTLLFIATFFIAIYHLFTKKYSINYQSLLLFSISWFIVELHKLGLEYLPTRYMISFYISMGFLFSIVLGNFLLFSNTYTRLICWGCLFSIFLFNSFIYKIAYETRSFTVSKANSYIHSITKDNDVIIGPWSPSLTWETKGYSYPIWKNFLGKRKIIQYYHPDLIISEFNEEDSGLAYKKNKIYLNKIGDSLTQLRVILWDLNVFRVVQHN